MKETNNTLTWTGQKEWEPWTGSNRCPECGGDEIEYNTMLVLASNPPQSQLRCKSCGYYFSSGIKTDLIDSDALNKVYEEIKKSFGIPEIRDPLPGETPYIGDWPPSLTPDFPPLDIEKATMYGWICPKCGRALAPHMDSCPYCSTGNNQLSTINTTL